jgi:hypothetical protein
MKQHPRRTSSIVIALTALCFVWLLSGQLVSVPAFAEGGNPPFPGEGLPIDTTIIPDSAVVPEGDAATVDVIGVVILFFTAVL